MTPTRYKEVEYVSPDKIEIHESVLNVRTKITKSECSDLMKSIKERGVQTPIVCFRIPNKSLYFLVSGERRLRSVQWLAEEDPKDNAFKTIPVLVKEYKGTEEEIFNSAMYDNFIENVQRSDLNGMDMATRLKFLIEEKGLSKDDIRKEIGKSITWINETLRFLDADPEVQKQVKDGNLSLDEGKKISKLPTEAQADVAKGLSQAKQIGDTKAKKKIKKKMDQATRVRSNVAPSKKEIGRARNTVAVILEEMKKAGDKDSKPFMVLTGAFMTLSFTTGEAKDLGLEKFLRRYKINVGNDGKRVVAKPKSAKKDSKKAAKKTAKKSGKKKSGKKKSSKKKR